MPFKENLKEKLKDKLTDEELNLLPRGFQTLGNVIILKLNRKLISKSKLIGQACLEILPGVKAVYLNRGKISGTFREPEGIEFIAGEDNPIVIHTEHGIKYKFDITKIMFSKGNINERKYLASLVKEGEIVVDMFAGIGYFSLPIAKLSKAEKIYSIELNPVAHNFFLENIKINKLEGKIVPILGDSNKEVLKLSESGIKADRVIMGVFPAPKDFIENALTLTSDNGTIFHYEGVRSKENYLELYSDFQEIASKKGYKCELLTYRFVKSYGPNLFHIVLDILVNK
ncbi:MAG: class I SAM-dependent methyltransferase [Promethearchaeia archaeon]